jgi:hypothetical protein
VHHDDVGHFQKTSLFPLQLVAAFGLNQQHQGVGEIVDGGVALAGADGLDEDHVEAERFQEARHDLQIGRDGAVAAGRGQTADEDAVVRLTGHAAAVAEKGAAGARALRIASEDGDAATLAAQSLDEPTDQRALAHARTAGERQDGAGLLGGSWDRFLYLSRADRSGILSHVERGEVLERELAARRQGQQLRECPALALAKTLQQGLKHGFPRAAAERTR